MKFISGPGENMARRCLVCSHREREEIDKALLKGDPLREITRRFRIDKSALCRHKQSHLSKNLMKSKELEEMTRADNLWDQIQWLKAKALSIARKAEEHEVFQRPRGFFNPREQQCSLVGRDKVLRQHVCVQISGKVAFFLGFKK